MACFAGAGEELCDFLMRLLLVETLSSSLALRLLSETLSVFRDREEPPCILSSIKGDIFGGRSVVVLLRHDVGSVSIPWT